MTDRTHYFVWYKCKNCGYEANKQLPFATEAPSPAADPCANCGCAKLMPNLAKKPQFR